MVLGMDVGSLLTGLWLGQQRAGDLTTNIKWCLSLTPDQTFPSAFGVSYETSTHTEPHFVPLKGDYFASNHSVVLKQTQDGAETCFEGQLQWCVDSGEWSIVGKWRQEGGSHGVFGLCREADALNVVCGLWLGRSVPDPSLDAFCIPTNPIKWSLALLANVPDHFSAFGGGYFDDSADVPNSPVLCYSLEGQWADDMSVRLLKRYEDRALGHEVEYKGTLSVDEQGMFWLKGTWTNMMAGSHGSFECRRCESAGAISSGICLCDGCHDVIAPGRLRWNCVTCTPSWNACEKCYNKSKDVHPHVLSPESVYNVKKVDGESCAELIWNAFNVFGAHPFLGGPGDFTYASYSEVAASAVNFACALRKWGCQPNTFAVVCMDSSPLCATVLLGCLLHGCAVVPVTSLYGVDTLGYILAKVQADIFVVDPQAKSMLLKAIRTAHITPRLVVEARPPPYEVSPSLGEGALLVSVHMGAFLHAGRLSRELLPFTLPKRDPSQCVAVLFTSGSTGRPKGAVFPEYLALPRGPITAVQPFVRLDFQTFDPAFLLSLLSTLRCGGRRAFSSVTTVMQDLPLVRPTHLGATPIFWNMLHQLYLSGQRTPDQLRESLGNRLHVATSGGAAISSQVLDFVRTQLGIDVVDNYGARETGGIARKGLVYPGVDIELLPVPELGYFPTSTPPQGEICVYSPQVIPEYYNDEELNAASFVEVRGKRFYRTGDVGEIVSATKSGTQLRIIDRCSSFFKLAQGEWISQAQVETVFELAAFVDQMFLWGSASLSYCVAVVVPSSLAREWGEEKMLSEIRHWGTHQRLRPFEIPQAVVIEREPWTDQNGFLTTTFKKNRHALLNQYRQQLQSLSTTVGSGAAPLPHSVSPLLTDALRQVCPGVKFDGNTALPELGLDSLSVALFRTLLPSAKHLSLETLFSYNLAHLSHLLSSPTSITSVSTPSIDWHSESRLAPFPELPSSVSASHIFGPHILLTGCTGFLGPVLLANLLQLRDEHVICLVRGSNEAEAVVRVREGLRSAGCWQESWESRITILLGDLAKPLFGCEPARFVELSRGLTDVFHNGAQVNMLLPYAAMRPANVQAVRTVIHLAHLSKATVHFVSSVSALGSTPQSSCASWVTLTDVELNSKEPYGQTKVVGERLLQEAHSKFGLKVRVFRPSVICSHSETGFTNVRDFTVLLLVTIVSLGCVVADATLQFKWISVNEVAARIVKTSGHQLDDQVVVQNLLGSSVSLSTLVSMLREYFPIEPVTVEEWRSRVSSLPSTHPASTLRELFATMNFFPPLSSSIPHSQITPNFVCNMVRFMSNEGLLPLVKYCASNRCFNFATSIGKFCAVCVQP